MVRRNLKVSLSIFVAVSYACRCKPESCSRTSRRGRCRTNCLCVRSPDKYAERRRRRPGRNHLAAAHGVARGGYTRGRHAGRGRSQCDAQRASGELLRLLAPACRDTRGPCGQNNHTECSCRGAEGTGRGARWQAPAEPLTTFMEELASIRGADHKDHGQLVAGEPVTSARAVGYRRAVHKHTGSRPQVYGELVTCEPVTSRQGAADGERVTTAGR